MTFHFVGVVCKEVAGRGTVSEERSPGPVPHPTSGMTNPEVEIATLLPEGIGC